MCPNIGLITCPAVRHNIHAAIAIGIVMDIHDLQYTVTIDTFKIVSENIQFFSAWFVHFISPEMQKNIDKGGSMMLSLKNTKNANFLFIVDMLKDLLSQELITEKEYDRAKKYYRKLTGADIVLAQ